MQSAWAAALAVSGQTDGSSIKLLADLLESPKPAGSLQDHILPAVVFLERCGGQHVEAIAPGLLKKLTQLQKELLDPATHIPGDAYERLLAGLSRIVPSPDIPPSYQVQFSGAAAALLQASLQHATAAQDGGSGEATGADAVIRAALRRPDLSHALLPQDAAKLVSWAQTSLLTDDGLTKGAFKGPTWRQEGVVQVLVAALQAMTPVPDTSLGGTTRTPAGQGSAASAQGVLLSVIDWARRIIQVAMSNFSLGASTAGTASSPLSGTATRAAARLCLAALLALQSSDSSQGPGIQEEDSAVWMTPCGSMTSQSNASLASASQVSASQVSAIVDGTTPSTQPLGTSAQKLTAEEGTAAVQLPDVEEVVDEVLGLVEVCVSAGASDQSTLRAGASVTHHPEASERVLLSAVAILEQLQPLMAWNAAQGSPMTTCLPQLKSMVLTMAATLPSGVSGAVLRDASDTAGPTAGLGWWAWDLHEPLTTWGLGASASQTPPPGTESSARLLLLLSELLCTGLAAAWQAESEQQALVQALLLPPEPTLAPPSEVKVMTLIAGRVYILLKAEPQLSHTLIPLMIDCLSSSAALAAPGSHTSASVTVALRPDVFACLAFTLAGMAACAACKRVESTPKIWTYQQVCDLLIRLYRESCTYGARHKASNSGTNLVMLEETAQPSQQATATPKGDHAHPLDRAPVLASALAHLAHDLTKYGEASTASVRRQLRYRLLSLFCDLAAIMGSADPASLGRLLPAIAAACERHSAVPPEGDKRPGMSHSMHALSRSRVSYADVAKSYHDDATLVKLLRAFWLYVAVHGLAKASSPATWRRATGRIAAASPVLMAGMGSDNDIDTVERLKAELGEPLANSGAAAEPARLRATLLSTLDLGPGSPGLSPPLEAAAQGYLLAVATCELARAGLAPLPGPGGMCPLSITLAYLQMTRSSAPFCAWYKRVAEQAATRYLATCEAMRAASLQELAGGGSSGAAGAAVTAAGAAGPVHGRVASVTGPPAAANSRMLSPSVILANATTSFVDTSAPWWAASGPSIFWPGFMPAAAGVAAGGQMQDRHVVAVEGEDLVDGRVRASVVAAAQAHTCVEQLAVTLILHLSNWEGHTEGAPAEVVQTSQQLLLKLLSRYPTLYWSSSCFQALLSMLQLEEGDRPLGAMKGATSVGGASSVVWRVIQSWVYNAASAAPGRTEALLHQFLGQQSCVFLESSELQPQLRPFKTAGSVAAATTAALRRSTDLLAAAASARASSHLSAAATGSGDTTLALCRKQYYSGLVMGLTWQREAGLHGGEEEAGGTGVGGGAGVAAWGRGVVEGLRSALRNHMAGPVLQQRYMCGAAVLALAQPAASDIAMVFSGDETLDEEETDRSEGGDQVPHRARALSAGQGTDSDLACLRDAHNYDLLQALCAVPVERFTPEVMSMALFAWTWVGASSPGWLLPLASRCVSAWCASVDRRVGLFSGDWGHAVGTGFEEEVEHELHEGETVSGDDRGLLAALLCHQQWLCFFSELWDSVGDRSDQDMETVATLLQRALHCALSDVTLLCTHPAAAAPRFHLLTLALQVARQCRLRARSGSGRLAAFALLQDKALRAGLEWYSAHLSQQQSEEQCTAVRDLVTLLEQLMSESKAAFAPVQLATVYAPGQHGRSFLEANTSQGTAQMATTSAPEPPNPSNRPTAHPVWGSAGNLGARAAKLLLFLCQKEVDRLQVWAKPVSDAPATASNQLVPTNSQWDEYVETAWQVSPAVAVALTNRFPGVAVARKLVVERLREGCWRPDVQSLPEAAMMLALSPEIKASSPELLALTLWAPGTASEGLQLISSKAGSIPVVKAYAVRCLENTPPEKVTFYLSQLVQCLREDQDGAIAKSLLHMAQQSDLFAHQLIWALQTEEEPPQEAFNPEVKRSGWQPPKDYGLWKVAGSVRQRAVAALTPTRREYWEAEDEYFNKVTSISGILKKIEKDERRAAIATELAKFQPPRADLYVPTNPSCRVMNHDQNSGRPMQSAAKVPIMVAFIVDELPYIVPGSALVKTPQPSGSGAPVAGVSRLPGAGGAGLHHALPPSQTLSKQDGAADGQQQHADTNGALDGNRSNRLNKTTVHGHKRKLACIFKVGDDCRQDVLALQVIQLLKDAFAAAGLPAYLCPYGCLPTGYERGIIEMVPNTASRAGLGEMSDQGLYGIFQAMFGSPGSPGFEQARQNFIASEAGYAIACFLLQAKDRHNGNLLISDKGHLIHIDFGFILEISPGGNLGFESAAFKLSHEMAQLLDPGGGRTSSTWKQFEELCVRCYLVARTVAEPIIATVALMQQSGLPCFGRGAPIDNLRRRFQLEMTEKQAAAFMREQINDAYNKWTTGFYDYIQNLQNKIPY